MFSKIFINPQLTWLQFHRFFFKILGKFPIPDRWSFTRKFTLFVHLCELKSFVNKIELANISSPKICSCYLVAVIHLAQWDSGHSFSTKKMSWVSFVYLKLIMGLFKTKLFKISLTVIYRTLQFHIHKWFSTELWPTFNQTLLASYLRFSIAIAYGSFWLESRNVFWIGFKSSFEAFGHLKLRHKAQSTNHRKIKFL